MKIKKISKKNVLLFALILAIGFFAKDVNAFDHDYQLEGEAFYGQLNSASGNLPLYRFWSDTKQGHFYTISEEEKNYVINNYPEEVWKYEGIAYYAFPSQVANTSPVHRFWSDCRQRHFYTISETEKDMLTSSYVYCDPNPNLLGPEITVGIWSFTRDELENDAFEIDANKDYVIKNDDGKIIGTIDKDTRTKVKYNGSGELRVYDSISDTISDEIVYFESADGNNSEIIFDVHLPSYGYDEYRGKIRLRYSDSSKKIWVINALPLEHYVWGDGELAGTGDADHNRVMVTSFRTYGYWWIQYATKYASEGFKVNATPGNQIYRGYEYERDHPRVREAAEDTRGKIVMHDGETAITPYSSWTDGETRCFPKVWGDHDSGCSDTYSWCKSVDDPYGDYNGDYWDNSYKNTDTLMNEGNHMVGLSAHGSVTLANDKGWSWTKILNYYFDDIDITSIY